VLESASGAVFLGSERRACNSAGSAEKGTELAKSSSLHSGFSSSINSGFGLCIPAPLLPVRLSKANHSQRLSAHRKHQRIKRVSDQTQRSSPNFAVILAVVDREAGSLKIKIRHHIEAKAAFPNVAFALAWVVRDLHIIIVAEIWS